MAKIKYDWKITAKKFLIVLGEVFFTALLSFLTQEQLFMFLIPIIEAVRNYLKNRNL